MKIKKIDLFPIRLAFKESYRTSGGDYPTDRLIIKIYTNENVIGIAECMTSSHYGEPLGSVISAMRIFRQELIGEDPFKLTKILKKLDKSLFGHPHAKSAIDVALHDIIGKKLGVPINVLLGGSYREKIPMACYIGAYEDPITTVQKWMPERIKFIKLKIGLGPEKDLENLKKLYENFPDIPVIADANEAYGIQHLSLFKKMERYDNLKSIEQPVPRWNLELMKMLTEELEVLIMADESVSGLIEAFQVIKIHAADIIKVQWRRVGGLYRAKQVIGLAKSAGIPVFWEGPILSSVGSAACLHLASSIPEEDVIYMGGGVSGPLRVKQDIVKEPLKYDNGRWDVPNKPGLGVQLDDIKLNKVTIQI